MLLLDSLGSAGLTGTQGWRKKGYYRLEGRPSHTQLTDLRESPGAEKAILLMNEAGGRD